MSLRLGPSQVDHAVTAVLDRIGKAKNVSLTQIALAYVMVKQPYIFPIVGVRKVEHLHDNIAGLKVHLNEAEIKQIDESYDFELGFPYDFIAQHPLQNGLLQLVGHCDWVEPEKSLNAK